MKTRLFCITMLLSGWSICSGQSNSAAPACLQFCVPPVRLRAEPAKQELPPQEPVTAPAPNPAPVSITVSSADLDGEFSSSRVCRSDRFYLVAPTPGSETPLARGFDSVFRPEVLHIGKTTLSCSFITAIKRKNPLCLLNPIFFNLSW